MHVDRPPDGPPDNHVETYTTRFVCGVISAVVGESSGAEDTVEALTVLTDVADRRQSDPQGRGLLFKVDLKAGAIIVDPGAKYHPGPAPNHLQSYEYIKCGADGCFLLRDARQNIDARSYYINEALGDAEPNVEWSAVRPPRGGVCFAWKLTRDVRKG